MKVIYMMADTFRRDHMGAYGNDWIHTPNLDKLAAGAALFENAYIGSFPTVPNRRDTLLGRGGGNMPFNGWRPLDRDDVTFLQFLTEKNIPSQLITDTQNNVTGSVGKMAMNLFRDYTAWTLNRGQEGDTHWLDANVPLKFPVPHRLIRYRAEMWHQILVNRAHRQVETDWFAPGTYSIATKWLERNYKRDDFFLWIDTFDPHEPWDPPQHYIDLYDPGYKGRIFDAPTYGLRRKMGITDSEMKHIRACYAGEVTMIDTCVGRLLETVERLGIADETMIVFTSDHGTMMDGPGDNGLICKPNTIGADGMCMSAGRPMKEPKQFFPIFQNVARVPLLIRIPGMKKGKRVKAIVQPWDMSATILDAFGIKKPKEFIGSSLLPHVRGKGKTIRDTAVCGSGPLAQAMDGRWVYTVWQGQRPASLIDLKSDPLAKKNVIKKNPAVAKRLHKQILAFMRRQGIAEELIAKYREFR
ncbi:MAG: sulfatase [Planctomycetes bacterium]|nr:sulfatase [Planctomycetota bacterium]